MKNRNVILSLTVMVASIGSALATSFLVVTPTWVHGYKYVSGGPIVETCSTLGKKCEPTGTANCEITINVGGTPTSTVGYSTNACTVPLRKTAGSGAIDDGRSTIYQTYDNYYAN